MAALFGLCVVVVGRGLRRVLLRRGALQDLNFLSVLELIEVLAFARRGEVHVEFGAGRSVGLHLLAGIVAGQLLEGIVNILRNQAALLDPAFLSGVGAHPQETPLLLQNFYAIAAMHRADLVVHSGHSVAQAGLLCRDVHVFVLGECSAFAGADQH